MDKLLSTRGLLGAALNGMLATGIVMAGFATAWCLWQIAAWLAG
jgi:hypothetical protein